MKLGTVLLQIALVVAGIALYDMVRTDPRPIEDLEPLVASEPPPDWSREPVSDLRSEEDRDLGLTGTGAESLILRLTKLEHTVSQLRSGLAEATTARAEVRSRPSYEPDPDVDPAYPDAAAEFTPTDVKRFRKLKAEVQRLEQRERYTKMIHRQLDQLEADLTQEQRQQVILTTLDFQERARAVTAAHKEQSLPREDRMASLDQLRSQFDQALLGLIPASEAEKIRDILGRYGGLGVRRPFGGGGRDRR